jgi:cytochrome P450
MALPTSWLLASLAAGAVSILTLLARTILSTIRRKDFPQGPSTLPLLGNLHRIPLKRPFVQFAEWSKAYGDTLGLKVGPGNLVVLYNPAYVHGLFNHRGTIYSGRPYNYVACEHVLGGGGSGRSNENDQVGERKHVIFMQNDEYLRRYRPAIKSLLSPARLEAVLPIQEATAAVPAHKTLMCLLII